MLEMAEGLRGVPSIGNLRISWMGHLLASLARLGSLTFKSYSHHFSFASFGLKNWRLACGFEPSKVWRFTVPNYPIFKQTTP